MQNTLLGAICLDKCVDMYGKWVWVGECVEFFFKNFWVHKWRHFTRYLGYKVKKNLFSHAAHYSGERDNNQEK